MAAIGQWLRRSIKDNKNVINITNLSFRVGNKLLLKNINLYVKKGKLLGLIGHSGSGKTSLLRIIAGLDRPFSGEVKLADQIVCKPGWVVPPNRRRIAMIFQSLALWPHMTVKKHLEFVIKKAKFNGKKKINHHIEFLLCMMHLNGYQNRYPYELSGGEQQRLAIARALASDPEYLLMDEPFTGLDDILKKELLDSILALKLRRKVTIIYVTHNIDEALSLSDQISIMREGTIVNTMQNTEDLKKEDLLDFMDNIS